jgi:hypothetical protein
MRGVSLMILLLSSLLGYGQESKPDTSFLALSKKQAIKRYTTAMANQSRLYNGSDYVYYLSKNEEHPYYQVDDWSNGSIVYWGEIYENIPLMYDLSIDHVITEHNRGNLIKLLSEKVQSFTLVGHTFIRLYPDEKNKISEGFYDRLYDGKLKVYGKYGKVYAETLEARTIIPRFDESTRYYIVKDGIFNVVRSKRSALNVLADRKPEIKAFLRKNKLHFKLNREKAIIQMAEYYDTLK